MVTKKDEPPELILWDIDLQTGAKLQAVASGMAEEMSTLYWSFGRGVRCALAGRQAGRAVSMQKGWRVLELYRTHIPIGGIASAWLFTTVKDTLLYPGSVQLSVVALIHVKVCVFLAWNCLFISHCHYCDSYACSKNTGSKALEKCH